MSPIQHLARLLYTSILKPEQNGGDSYIPPEFDPFNKSLGHECNGRTKPWVKPTIIHLTFDTWVKMILELTSKFIHRGRQFHGNTYVTKPFGAGAELQLRQVGNCPPRLFETKETQHTIMTIFYKFQRKYIFIELRVFDPLIFKENWMLVNVDPLISKNMIKM